jgi:hypothetical protein
MTWLSHLFTRKPKTGLGPTPDFAAAPSVAIDLSGARLQFKDPRQTAHFPIKDHPYDLNIFHTSMYREINNYFNKRFYEKGWDLYSWGMQADIAGIVAGGIIFDCSKTQSPTFNAFRFKDLGGFALRLCHDNFAERNNSTTFGNVGTGYYQYPSQLRQLKIIKTQNNFCLNYTSGHKGDGPTSRFMFPLTKNHIIMLSFRIDSYKGCDYYDPTYGLEPTCEGIIEEFLENFHLELSTDAALEEKSVASEGLAALYTP